MVVSISARHLSVLIPLLASKTKELKSEFLEGTAHQSDLNEEDLEERLDLQEMIAQYEDMLDQLGEEYNKALAAGANLPSFDELVAPFDSA